MKSILREQRRSIVAAAVTILLGLMLVLVPNRSIRFCAACWDRPAGDGADLYPGVVRQAADGFPCVVSDPGLLLAALGCGC